jgi:AraC family transcriptional regulator
MMQDGSVTRSRSSRPPQTALTPRSAIEFVRAGSNERVDAHRDAQVQVSSRHLAWPGVAVEGGRMPGWEVQDLVVPQHMIALNRDSLPLVFERVEQGRTRQVVMSPGSVWVNPAGESVTHRIRQHSLFLNLTVSEQQLIRLNGQADLGVRGALGVEHPQLAALMTAVAEEAHQDGRHGPALLDSLTSAVVTVLTADFAARRTAPASVGGLSARQVQAVTDLLESRLAAGVSVVELAAQCGYSPAHFSRAFRAAAGTTPHQYLIQRRLHRARELLLASRRPIAQIAADVGFTDHAHLTRWFRRQYGVAPSALRESGG